MATLIMLFVLSGQPLVVLEMPHVPAADCQMMAAAIMSNFTAKDRAVLVQCKPEVEA